MKPIMTFLCSLCFGIAGICLAITSSNSNPNAYARGNTITAATVPIMELPKLPLDLQLDMEKKYSKTDTVYVPQEFVVVNSKSKSLTNRHKSKHALANASMSRQSLRSPTCEPDTIVKNQACGDREEYTPDTIGPPKGSIILVVDGEEVYKR